MMILRDRFRKAVSMLSQGALKEYQDAIRDIVSKDPEEVRQYNDFKIMCEEVEAEMLSRKMVISPVDFSKLK